MTTLKDFNRYGEELEQILMLKTSPVAVKMLVKEADIPEGAIRPKKDRGYHLAVCQAFAMSRRDKATIAMLKEDHWCPSTLMAYGLVKSPAMHKGHPYDSFELGKYIGIVTAPLKTAAFKPDVVLIYSNNAQLRSLLLMMNYQDVADIKGRYFPPSCAHVVVSPMLTGQYSIVLPDPGEFQRALTGEDEMIFCAPGDKMEALINGVRQGKDKSFAYAGHHMMMRPDFPHPEFYKNFFRNWGLEVKEDKS